MTARTTQPSNSMPATQRDISELKQAVEQLVINLNLQADSEPMSKDIFCDKYPIWAQMLDCILDLAIIFTLYDRSLDLASVLVKRSSKPLHPALIAITSHVYQLVLDAHVLDGGSNVAEEGAVLLIIKFLQVS
jgi:hypothetical protein